MTSAPNLADPKENSTSRPAEGERPPAPSDGYRIGTVAGLTGLDPHTIRAWERRHRAVEPGRTERGTRVYDDACVERLQLLKTLVDCGEPIRKVASLTDAALRERIQRIAGLSLHAGVAPGSDAPPLDLGILSGSLQAQLEASSRGLPGFRVVASHGRRQPLVEALRRTPCDVLLLDLEQLGSEPLRALDALVVASEAPLVVILYTFARRGLLTRLARRGARLVRGPIGLEQIHRTLADLVTGARATELRSRPESRPIEVPVVVDGAEPAPRRFDDARLARLAEISTAIECECPQHLSGLVRSLLAFESYSRDCESRDGEDAAMHQRLARGTGQARAVMEDLLDALCEYEGIEL